MKIGKEQMSEHFYWNVKALSKSKGIHISDIEKEIGFSKGYLSRYASRGMTVSIYDGCRIAEMLGVRLMDLIEKDFARDYKEQCLQDKIDQLQEELRVLKGEKA